MNYGKMFDTSYPTNLHYSTGQCKPYLKEAKYMNIFDATQTHYNAAGVHPTTDPDNPRSQFAVNRYENHLPKLIRPGMRTLDLGCNAGRFTFAMEDMGAIAIGIDCAEIPLLHAKKVAHRRKSQCQFNIGDIAALPYKENSFDLAFLPQNNGYLSYQILESLTVQLKEILSDNGIFVVIMHDELVKRAGEESLSERYDVQTGLMEGNRTIPNKGVYASPWYFWTIAFARYIIEKHLLLEKVEQIEENRFLLVFRNKKRNGVQ
ncbi:hypothetical protein C6503_00300 [Candidatus Poribacteria bacterium]|nr:MAG: hypothetical protein C6503_00300 [Candidatus Poribacteria bacterium]